MLANKTFFTTFITILTLFLVNAFAQQQVPFTEHGVDRHQVSAIAFSPDGKTLAIGYDKSIRLVDVKSNKVIHILEGNRKISGEIAFSSNGKFIASGDKNNVRVWRTKNGKRFRNFKGHKESVRCVAFSSDGQFLASGSDDESIRIWDLKAEEELLHLFIPNPTELNQEIQQIVFIPNSNVLVANHFGHSKLRYWDINTGELLKEIETWFGIMYSIDFSTDWKKFVFGAYGGMQLWDFENEVFIRDIVGPFWFNSIDDNNVAERLDYTFIDIDLSPDGKTVVATQREPVVELWDATITAREPKAVLVGHEGKVMHVAFNPDGSLVASADTQGIVRLWQVSMILENQEDEEVAADLNGDGIVNIQDLVIVAKHFGTSNSNADVNDDGTVNIQDLVIVANAFM